MQKLLTKREDLEILKESGADLIGYGALSQVRKARHKATGKIYALKEMDLKMIHINDIKNIHREIKTQMYLDHPNIVHLYDSIQTPDNVLLLLLEYADNNNLFHFIQGRPLDEKMIHKFFFQTVQAIEYIHKRKIMHRDLKPENILLDKNYNVKVCDFGWCAEYNEQERRQTFCGTSEYMAPEIIDSKAQDPSIDIWSLGILLYEMYHKKAPYRGTNPHEILKDIKRKRLTFTEPRMCQEARDLVEKILVVDPKRRITIEEMYKHPYFSKFPFFKLDTPDPKQVKSARRSYVASPSKAKAGNFDFGGESANQNRPADKTTAVKQPSSGTEGTGGFSMIKVLPATSQNEPPKSGLGGTYTDSTKGLPILSNGLTGNSTSSFSQVPQSSTVQSSIQGNQLSQSLVFQSYGASTTTHVANGSYNIPTLISSNSVQSPASLTLPPNPITSIQSQPGQSGSSNLIPNFNNYGTSVSQPVNITSAINQPSSRQETLVYGQFNQSLNQSLNMSQAPQRLSGNSHPGHDQIGIKTETESHSRKPSDFEDRSSIGGIRRISNQASNQSSFQQISTGPAPWRPLTSPWQPPSYPVSSVPESREGTITKKTYDAPTYNSSLMQPSWGTRTISSPATTTTTTTNSATGVTTTTTTTSGLQGQQQTPLLSSSSTLTNYTQLVSGQPQLHQTTSYPSSSVSQFSQPVQRTPPSSFSHTNSYYVQQTHNAPVYNNAPVSVLPSNFGHTQTQNLFPTSTNITSSSISHYPAQSTNFYQPAQVSQVSRGPTPLLPSGAWSRPQVISTGVVSPQAPTYVLGPSAGQTSYSVIQR